MPSTITDILCCTRFARGATVTSWKIDIRYIEKQWYWKSHISWRFPPDCNRLKTTKLIIPAFVIFYVGSLVPLFPRCCFRPLLDSYVTSSLKSRTYFYYTVITVSHSTIKLFTSQCRSQWPRGLRRRSAAARLLRSWVRTPPGAWMLKSVYSAVRTGSLNKAVCALSLTVSPLTWKIWWAPNNASKWQMGFNSAFKGLKG